MDASTIETPIADITEQRWTMNLDEFHTKLTVSLLMVMGKGFKSNEVEVMITKSSGETLFCLMNDNDVVDYFKL